MRSIICADCHGRPELISNVIDHSEYRMGEDRLIFAGDFLDIGPDPIACMNLLCQHGAEILWGNHDVAAYFGLRISPQNRYEDAVYEKLNEIAAGMRVSTIVDGNILVTHAGVGEKFLAEHFNSDDDIELICSSMNALPLNVLWDDYTPLWYRPNKYDQLVDTFQQVFGHTPAHDLPFGCSVDPWTPNGFDSPNRYRYVVVEDGKIVLHDGK